MDSQLQGEIKGEISTDTVPCMHVEWKVPEDILMSPRDTNHRIYSPNFHFKDATWYLSLTINAPKHKAYDSFYDSIDIYIVKKYAVSSTFRVIFHIGVKKASGNTYWSAHGCNRRILESELHTWGQSNILSRSEISKKKTELVHNGVVRFFCYFWVEDIMNSERDWFNDPLTTDQISENIGELSIEIVPIAYAEWNVPGITLLSEDNKHRIRSSNFQFKDEMWYFYAAIHDTEFRDYNICGPIHLHLVRKQCAAPTLNIHCVSGIKLVDGSIYRDDHKECLFQKNVDCHLLASDVSRLDENIIQAPDGEVKFFFYLRLDNSRSLDAHANTKPEDNNKSEEEVSESEAYSQRKSLKDIDVKQELQKRAGLEKLVTDFRNLFLSGDDSDVTIRVNIKEFKVHKYILRARSTVFHSMFAHDMEEKNSGTVDITDCNPDAFEIYLLYIYSGSIENLSTNTVFDLFTVADKYDAQELKHQCKEFMVTNLSVDTVCDVIELALQYNEAEFLKTATDFFAKNLKDIIPTVKWQSFLLKNSIGANELLITALNYYVLKE